MYHSGPVTRSFNIYIRWPSGDKISGDKISGDKWVQGISVSKYVSRYVSMKYGGTRYEGTLEDVKLENWEASKPYPRVDGHLRDTLPFSLLSLDMQMIHMSWFVFRFNYNYSYKK